MVYESQGGFDIYRKKLITLIRNQVDLSQARNLIIVSVTLVFGIGGMTIGSGDFSLSGISLCAIIALLLNVILPGNKGWKSKLPTGDEDTTPLY